MQSGVSMREYVANMDRAGIERSLLIADRAGDMWMRVCNRERMQMKQAVFDRALFGLLRDV